MTEAEDKASGANRKRLFRVIRIVVSTALIAWVLSRIDIAETLRLVAGADPLLLLAALGLNFVGSILTASRWRILLEVQGATASRFHLVQRWMEACFFNQFLPSTIGGDTKRIYDSWKLGASKSGAVAAVGVDRLLGLAALLAFGFVAFWISAAQLSSDGTEVILIGAGVLVLGLAIYLVFHPPAFFRRLLGAVINMSPGFVRRLAEKVSRAFTPYHGKTGVLASGLFWSFLLQFNVICFYALVGAAVGLDISFLVYMQVIPVASVVLLLPITINGIGLREGIFALLLAGFAVSGDAAVAFAWTSFIVFSVFGLLGGIVYALSPDKLSTEEGPVGQ